VAVINRELFGEEHELFRDTVRKFIEREIRPHHAQWEAEGIVPRELWLKAGEAGLLCCTIAEEYGGLGLDYLFDVVVFEELAKSGFTGPGFLIHCDLVATYIKAFGSEEQKRQWLPKMVTGEAIGSLGMTEPHAGSDLKNIRTRAVRDGEHFVINGQKVFISNGQLCDIIVLATKTDSAAGAKGITLFLVDTSLPGFKRGKKLSKLGLKAQDTSELFFEDLRVPASSMLGVEGHGFALMMTQLAQERLAQAIRSAAVAEEVIAYTVEYTSQRKAFGQTIGDFQNTQFKLAELKTEAVIGRVFTDRCIQLFMHGELDAVHAAMAKMWLSNLHCKVVDECLQLFGGWGYMWEYPIARAYADARIVKIAGGSIEIMKYIIGRSLFDAEKAKAGGASRSAPGGWEKPARSHSIANESAPLGV
jgi:acyl-CoA dehydrogenase